MKKVLKQQARELEHYVKAKHTQEECIGFIDGFERANELFALYSVSQQRELFVAMFDKMTDDDIQECINGFAERVFNRLSNQ